ncbi:MAG: hypothetical protein AB1449_10760 [Chloroflexota bacterium]
MIHRWLLVGQRVIPRLPKTSLEALAGWLQRPDLLAYVMHVYWEAVDPDEIAAAWGSAEQAVPWEHAAATRRGSGTRVAEGA